MSIAISPSIPEGVAQCECEAKGAELMRLGEEEDDDDLFAAPEDAVINEDVQVAEPRADEPTEAHDAKIKTSPYLPSAAEVAKHCATHLPYRNWCPVCVKAKGREDARTTGSRPARMAKPVCPWSRWIMTSWRRS